MVRREVGRFISLESKPIKFLLYCFDSSADRRHYIVGFIIQDIDSREEVVPNREFYHRFKFNIAHTNYVFNEQRDLQHFLNCLRNIVIDGQYDKNNDNEHIIEKHDQYLARLEVSGGGIVYDRPPESLMHERIFLRNEVIKAIYSSDVNWVEWSMLMKIVPITPGVLRQMCDYLVSSGLLTEFENNKYKLTAAGYHLFEKQITPSTTTVFIIGSCAHGHSQWIDFYKKAILEAGLKPYFQEHEEPPREIIIEIYERLKNCAFVLADLTGGSENCLYELGYAHALNKKIILARDRADVSTPKSKRVRLSFDLNQFKHSFRNDRLGPDNDENKGFKAEIRERLKAVKAQLFEDQTLVFLSNANK